MIEATTIPQTSLRDELKNATKILHKNIEKVPFSLSIVRGTITKEAYIKNLEQLYYIHQTLEKELRNSDLSHEFYNPQNTRTSSIERDLKVLGCSEISAPLPETQKFIKTILELSQENSFNLLGILYIFEGSRMGSMILQKFIGKALQLETKPNNGLDYHIDGMETFPIQWKNFCNNLNQLSLEEETRQQLIQSAVITMENLYQVYVAIS